MRWHRRTLTRVRWRWALAHIGSTVHTLLGKSVELMVWSVCRGVGKIIMLLVFVGMITMIVVANFQL